MGLTRGIVGADGVLHMGASGADTEQIRTISPHRAHRQKAVHLSTIEHHHPKGAVHHVGARYGRRFFCAHCLLWLCRFLPYTHRAHFCGFPLCASVLRTVLRLRLCCRVFCSLVICRARLALLPCRACFRVPSFVWSQPRPQSECPRPPLFRRAYLPPGHGYMPSGKKARQRADGVRYAAHFFAHSGKTATAARWVCRQHGTTTADSARFIPPTIAHNLRDAMHPRVGGVLW